jgi:tetratricopeptide (TPR) repeat protein
MNRTIQIAIAVIAACMAFFPVNAFGQQDPPPGEEPPAAEDDSCDQDDPDNTDCVEPKIHIIGGSGSGGITFNWNGPGRLDYGVYDHGCINYEDEFRRLVAANQGLIGSVAPRAVTWEKVLTTVRARLEEPEMRAGYAAANGLPQEEGDYRDAGVAATLALGGQEAALAQLFAAVEKAPNDGGKLFNFAAALSQNQMPNEALAVLARIRELGQPPVLPLQLDGEAALRYQTGYAEMLRGELAAAKKNFREAFTAEPFLNEAAHALALIQAHEGDSAQGKETYRGAMWRFKPKYLIICSANVDEEVRPPVDDMYDTSMGKDVRLVEFWHPQIAGELVPFWEQATALLESRVAILQPLKQRMIAMGNNPRFATAMDRPYDAWAEKLTQLIAGLDEDEPYVLQQQQKLEKAIRTAERIAGQNIAFVHERFAELALLPGNHCPTYRSLISQGIQGVQPHAERVEAEYRVYARVWYKMATGLASNIGDPEWHEYNDVVLRAEIESMNGGMIGAMLTYYGFPALAEDCVEEFVEVAVTQEATPAGDTCKEMFGNLKVKQTVGMPRELPGPRFTAEVGCDSIKAEGEFDLLGAKAGEFGAALGAHASAEFKKGGDFLLFAGPRADIGAPGAEAGIKTGVFIKGSRDGLEDLGGRIEMEAKGGALGFRAGVKDEMNFGLMPAPKAAGRGPRVPAPAPLRSFRAPQ